MLPEGSYSEYLSSYVRTHLISKFIQTTYIKNNLTIYGVNRMLQSHSVLHDIIR